MVKVTLEVDGVYPGHLIGREGRNIHMIEDHYRVEIDYKTNEKRYVPNNNGTAIENL